METELMSLFTAIIFLIVAILILRGIGAWMLRINEVIKLEKEILEELKKQQTRS